jgi:hypothetical protein
VTLLHSLPFPLLPLGVLQVVNLRKRQSPHLLDLPQVRVGSVADELEILAPEFAIDVHGNLKALLLLFVVVELVEKGQGSLVGDILNALLQMDLKSLVTRLDHLRQDRLVPGGRRPPICLVDFLERYALRPKTLLWLGTAQDHSLSLYSPRLVFEVLPRALTLLWCSCPVI